MSHASSTPIDADALRIPAGSRWQRLPLIGGGIGILGIALSAMLGAKDPSQFYFSWLVSFTFWISIALGALFFVLTHYATRAHWSVAVRRTGENIMGTLPLFILLFIPIVLGMQELFHWTDAEHVAHDKLLQHKASWLNPKWFLIRAAFCFLSWSLLSWWFTRRSVMQDATGDPKSTIRMIQVSAPSLFLYGVTVTIGALDWLMGLDPHWYSTMFGVYYFSGGLVGFFAVMAILSHALRSAGLTGDVVTAEHFHDLGKLLFAFTVFWAYIGFSQYFLIWYGNIPEETAYYLHRAESSWGGVTMLLAVGHFGIPFLFLMSRHIKRRAGTLIFGALWMLVMHFLDLHWLVMPTHHKHAFHFSMLDLTTMVGIGGLFVAMVGWLMQRRALVAVGDPRLDESAAFENA